MSDQAPELTLGEFLEALQERGRDKEADKYWWELLLYSVSNGIQPDDILSMTLDECARATNVPQGPVGWNTLWGERVIYPDR